MAQSVVTVQPKQKDPNADLDVLLKGLNLAVNIYGQSQDRDRLKRIEEQTAAQRQAEGIAQAGKEGMEERRRREEMALKQSEAEKDRELKKELARQQVQTQKELANLKQSVGAPKLAKEDQVVVSSIAKKNADMKTISNLMESKLNQMEKAKTEDEAVRIGQEMLKTINSPLGADAVGAEEAQRLGGFLEYKIANFTQPGSFFGRDLDLFKNQIRANVQSINDTIGLNKNQIDEIYGRAPSFQMQQGGPPSLGGGSGTAMAAEAKPSLSPGAIFVKGGKRYKVDANGQSATEIP